MITITFPEFDVSVQCDNWWSGITLGTRGGYVDTPSEIVMSATFKERQQIFTKIALLSKVVEEMLVYSIEGVSPVSFGHVIVVREESLASGDWRVHMKALRMCDTGSTKPSNNRKCYNCNNPIEYWYVSSLMVNAGFHKKQLDAIWENDLFVFKCCKCMKGRGEYITVAWGGVSPPGTRIRGARCPPE